MSSTAPWWAAAEAMLNRNIDASSQAAMLAKRLNGTSLDVRVSGFSPVRAEVAHGRLSLLSPDESEPQASIQGSPAALLKMIKAGAVPSSADSSRGGVDIRGNAEVANLYKQLFTAARPDAEEELSRFIGDLPARGLMRAFNDVRGWFERAGKSAAENVAEYLTEESRDLPSRTEVEEFLAGVDGVRESADRLDARIRLLERSRGMSS